METSATPAKVSAKKHHTVKHVIDGVHTTKAKNGGYINRVSFRPKDGRDPYSPGSHKPDEEHAFGSYTEAVAHHAKSFGETLEQADKRASNQEGVEEMPTAKGA
jgi:hypothetical protein